MSLLKGLRQLLNYGFLILLIVLVVAVYLFRDRIYPPGAGEPPAPVTWQAPADAAVAAAAPAGSATPAPATEPTAPTPVDVPSPPVQSEAERAPATSVPPGPAAASAADVPEEPENPPPVAAEAAPAAPPALAPPTAAEPAPPPAGPSDGAQAPVAQADTATLAAARAAFWRGDFVAAERLYRALLAKAPDNPEFYRELGNVYLADGRLDSATEAWYQAGVRFAAAGRQADAWRMVRVLYDVGPERAELLIRKLVGAPR